MKVTVDKPSPITGGEMELCKELAEVTFRGEVISYEKSFYRCLDSGLEFVDEELENANLKLLYDTYRCRHSIPKAEELKEMRVRYGIPSSAMSIILGLGENQYGLYEEGAVPTVSVGKLLTLAMEPSNMRMMLQTARMMFTEKQYNKYYAAIEATVRSTVYENDGAPLSDYCLFESLISAPTALLRSNKSSFSKKESFNEYVYAPAC